MSIDIENDQKLSSERVSIESCTYPDKWLLIIGIPLWGFLLRHIGEPEAITQLLQDKQYYFDLAYAVVVIGIIWLMNRNLILQIERRYSWVRQTFQRLFIQGVLAYGLTFLFMLLISFIYNEFLINRPVGFNINNVFSADIPTSLLFVTILHLIYTGMWMVEYHKQTMEHLQQKLTYVQRQVVQTAGVKSVEGIHKRTLLVNQGRGFVPLAVEQVAYIFIANEVSIVKTLQGQSFTVDGTLEQLTEQLSPQDFFRISRQFIVQRTAIRKVENETSGRLLLQLQPEHSSEVTVSRRRAPDFRQWMGS